MDCPLGHRALRARAACTVPFPLHATPGDSVSSADGRVQMSSTCDGSRMAGRGRGTSGRPHRSRRWGLLVPAVLGAMALAWSTAEAAAMLEHLQQEIQELNKELLVAAFTPIGGAAFSLRTFEIVQAELDSKINESIYERSIMVYQIPGSDPIYGVIAPLGANPDNSTFGLAIGQGSEVTAAGYSDTDLGPFHAIKWTLSGGTIDLGTLPGNPPREPGASQDLPPTSQAFGISQDASVIVGLSTSATSIQTAFRWTAADATMRGLGALNGAGGRSVAFAANGDGSVVVGQSELAGNAPFSFPMHAFRWVLAPGTASGVMTDLDPSDQPSVATMVTPDGSVVVGAAGHLGVAQAFRWTQATGLVPLGALPGQSQSAAAGVSGDGSIVVGVSGANIPSNLPAGLKGLAGSTDTRAFRWTQATGLQDLGSLLSAAGVDMTGITLVSATAITQDGQFITGNAIFPDTPAGRTTVYVARYCDGGTCPSIGLVSSVLPASRSVQLGGTATAFGTMINAGPSAATGCAPRLVTALPGTFTYQTTDPVTNALIGAPNTPVSLAAGAPQSFVIAMTPDAAFLPTDARIDFTCTSAFAAPSVPGLNTLLVSASPSPVPDIVALGATGDPGIVDIPGTAGTGVFAVATVNVGAGGSMTVSADTGGISLPVSISLCQTDPATGACLGAPAGNVITQINAGDTPTFGIFVTGVDAVPFAPASNRVFVRFKAADGSIRGATSVAVRTQ